MRRYQTVTTLNVKQPYQIEKKSFDFNGKNNTITVLLGC
jgi:hypothetical protein